MNSAENRNDQTRQLKDYGNPLRQAREAKGYNLDELAVATGLTVEELENIEKNVDRDSARLRRVASVLQVELVP